MMSSQKGVIHMKKRIAALFLAFCAALLAP